ncbi:hypothetical protein ACFWN1_04415, partial [Streptomyces sp. NPDC058459]|uniref:hypothetical protein n=1 Tax=Streptomyces sp. NPDC058459 TaxID=3346508 RepID=UPI003648FA2D
MRTPSPSASARDSSSRPPAACVAWRLDGTLTRPGWAVALAVGVVRRAGRDVRGVRYGDGRGPGRE